VDVPGKIDPHYSPYEMVQEDKTACATENASKSAEVIKPIRIMSREERLAMAGKARQDGGAPAVLRRRQG
jgi:hypothetical protein